MRDVHVSISEWYQEGRSRVRWNTQSALLAASSPDRMFRKDVVMSANTGVRSETVRVPELPVVEVVVVIWPWLEPVMLITLLMVYG